jgi:hypothetical protein
MTVTTVSEAMRAAVGKQLRRRVSYPVAESDIRRWAIAVYYPEPPPPRFLDADVAARTSHRGIVAPEEFNPFAWIPEQALPPDSGTAWMDPDGIERLLGVPGPGLRFMLNGGMKVEYEAHIRPGDVITETSILSDYQERDGRLGLMLFTTVADLWTNQAGAVVKRSCQTVIRY